MSLSSSCATRDHAVSPTTRNGAPELSWRWRWLSLIASGKRADGAAVFGCNPIDARSAITRSEGRTYMDEDGSYPFLCRLPGVAIGPFRNRPLASTFAGDFPEISVIYRVGGACARMARRLPI